MSQDLFISVIIIVSILLLFLCFFLKNSSSKMGLLYKTKSYFNSNQLSTIYKSHIKSQMEYYSALWDGAGQVILMRLDRFSKPCNTMTRISQRYSTLTNPKKFVSLRVIYQYFYGRCLSIATTTCHKN